MILLFFFLFILYIFSSEAHDHINNRNIIEEEYKSVAKFDWYTANITVTLSAQAYCNPSLYLTQNYSDYAEGFIPTFNIFNEDHDLHGFIGFKRNDNSIYVVFRGSQSFENFIDDMIFFEVDYYPNLCTHNCSVHKGFHTVTQSVVSEVISEVKRLQQIYPEFSVVVTGHSLGAAVATLSAADLVLANVKHVRLFNYGSPRVGNMQSALFISNLISDCNRITHEKDIVPHMPLFDEAKFVHISGEWYFDEVGVHECEGHEDKKCSFQWYLPSIVDHMHYLHVTMGIQGCTLDDIREDTDKQSTR